MPTILLMDRETEKMDIPRLLEGYANVARSEELSGGELERVLGEADAIMAVFGKVSQKELALARKLRIVAVAAAGFDNVDVKAATARKIFVTRAGTATVEGVAEHAVGLMIALSKRLCTSSWEVRSGNWAYRNTPVAVGTQLFGKTAGIVGFGKVGRALARKALGLGMSVLAVDPYLTPKSIRDTGCEPAELDVALRRSDYLCLTSALTKETLHIIGDKEIGLMKKGSFLVNVARGGMIDEDALYRALAEGKTAGAGLDVLEREPTTSSPLFQLPNCIVTPHVAGLTFERYQDCGRVAVEEVKKVLAGGVPSTENLVNPEVLKQR